MKLDRIKENIMEPINPSIQPQQLSTPGQTRVIYIPPTPQQLDYEENSRHYIIMSNVFIIYF